MVIRWFPFEQVIFEDTETTTRTVISGRTVERTVSVADLFEVGKFSAPSLLDVGKKLLYFEPVER